MTEQRGGHGLRQLLGRHHFHPEALTPFFHLHRPRLHVERAGGDERLAQRLDVLRAHVVEVAGDDDHPGRFRRPLGDDDAQSVGVVFRVALPRAPSALHHPPPGGGRADREHSQQGSARRRRGLALHRPAARKLQPLEQDRRRGRGHGQLPVRRLHPPGPYRHGQVVDGLDAQLLETLDRTHDVEHCVHRAHLVEVHVVRRTVVHAALRFAYQAERVGRALPHVLGHGRALDQAHQLTDAAPVRMLGDSELDLFATDAAARRVADSHLDSRQAEPLG